MIRYILFLFALFTIAPAAAQSRRVSMESSEVAQCVTVQPSVGRSASRQRRGLSFNVTIGGQSIPVNLAVGTKECQRRARAAPAASESELRAELAALRADVAELRADIHDPDVGALAQIEYLHEVVLVLIEEGGETEQLAELKARIERLERSFRTMLEHGANS